MDKWKNKLRDIANFILGIIFCTCVSVLAETCTTTINSSDVTYGENSTAQAEVTNLISTAGNMNLRLTELEDYDLDNRLSTLEGYFKNNPTSYFNANGLLINIKGTDWPIIRMYRNSGTEEATLFTNDDGFSVRANSSTGVAGQGKLNLIGNPVKINGSNMNKTETVNCSLNSSVVSSGTIQCRVKNGIAQVHGNGIALKSAGNSQAIATGLPKPAIQIQTNTAGTAASTTASINAAGDVVWTSGNSGTLYMHAGSTYSYGHYFSLTYIVAD